MKNLIIPLTAFLLIFFINACKEKAPQQGWPEHIHVDPENLVEINRSDLLNLKKIIKLQDQPLIGNIWGLILGDEFMVTRSGQGVNLFDYDGNHIRSIGRAGRGPGEYLSLSGLAKIDTIIRVLDRNQNRVVDFNVNGEFIENHDAGGFGQSYTHYKGLNFVYLGNELNEYNKRLLVYDESFSSLVFKDFSLDDIYHYMNMLNKTSFFKYKDSLRYLNPFNYNYIHNINVSGDSVTVEERYFLDFGPYETPKSFMERDWKHIGEFSDARDEAGYVIAPFDYSENDKYIIFVFRYTGINYLAVYSKETNKTIAIEKILDDILFEGLKINAADHWVPYYYDGDIVYQVIDAYEFIDNVSYVKENMTTAEWESYSMKNPEVVELYNSLDESDNPLIVVYELNPDFFSLVGAN